VKSLEFWTRTQTSEASDEEQNLSLVAFTVSKDIFLLHIDGTIPEAGAQSSFKLVQRGIAPVRAKTVPFAPIVVHGTCPPESVSVVTIAGHHLY
jgi:hypothetical protein